MNEASINRLGNVAIGVFTIVTVVGLGFVFNSHNQLSNAKQQLKVTQSVLNGTAKVQPTKQDSKAVSVNNTLPAYKKVNTLVENWLQTATQLGATRKTMTKQQQLKLHVSDEVASSTPQIFAKAADSTSTTATKLSNFNIHYEDTGDLIKAFGTFDATSGGYTNTKYIHVSYDPKGQQIQSFQISELKVEKGVAE
ncbi:MAG: hypothetical protein LBT37_05970 [Lactobacillaceae bacterium]|jgi:hypothetical protein|nr:hypothetical protein [Lactobacillaceae bacterium]